jgi:hypothetical protein
MIALTAAAVLMRGVAGLPEAHEINGCDSPAAAQNPAKAAGNPEECRTFPCAEPSRPTASWEATERPGPGLRHRQALALPIYAAALLLVLLLPLGVLFWPALAGLHLL